MEPAPTGSTRYCQSSVEGIATMRKLYLVSVLQSKIIGNSIKEGYGSMCAQCVCGAFFVFRMYRSGMLLKFPSEPPAFTLDEVGGGDGNFIIPFGGPVFEYFKVLLKGWTLPCIREPLHVKARKSPAFILRVTLVSN
jgi:hypothetical protein